MNEVNVIYVLIISHLILNLSSYICFNFFFSLSFVIIIHIFYSESAGSAAHFKNKFRELSTADDITMIHKSRIKQIQRNIIMQIARRN